ncbi:MAG: DNA translocase FtsK, partial [Myxococcales bacterium]|nr:DNA translocase FtsK [Myxococcales bacterium]
RPVEPIIHQRPRIAAAPAAAPAEDRERSVLAGLAQAMRHPANDEIERVIEAARAAGFFDVETPRTPADAPPATTPPVPDAATAAVETPAAGTPADAAPAAKEEAAADATPPEPVIVEGPRRRREVRRSGTLAAEPQAAASPYALPGLELLADPPEQTTSISPEVLRDYAAKLTQTLKNYGIEGEVREIHPGPVVTTYEFCPAAGTRLSRISSLENDVAMAMAVTKVRIVAPIPGKNAVGFEIPNPTRETVYLKELLADPAFAKRGGMLPIAIGKDLTGQPYYSDLAKMPHLLVAGATGTGKSVFINATLVSLLYRQTAEQMRLLLIDPKHVELIAYDRIPHLLLPVVSDMRKAALALRWAVGEMERRYHLFATIGARQLTHYNQKVAALRDGGAAAAPAAGQAVKIVVKGPDGVAREVAPAASAPAAPPDQPLEKLPALVIVIDELAELMSVAAKDVESAIQRLAQKGRAAGIHLIVATQRPSVDVITGTIKANFPTRLSFKVSSKTDSRTVLDQNGADQLLGMGDMLLLPPGASDLLRIQACYVSEDEIERVVQHIRVQGEPTYDESIVAEPDEDGEDEDGDGEEYDEHWEPALELTLRLKQASISKIQRHLRIGYNRAARIVERMEREGLVGPGSNPREKEIYADRIMERLDHERSRAGDEAADRPTAAP